jgi:hypothetical protein
VLCAVTISPADLRSLSLYYYTVAMWPHVYVICACLVFLSVGDLLVCILRNNTNSTNANQREE